MTKVWFITGTSRGFGRVWAEAALERGDQVAATARDTGTLQPLVERYGDAVLPLALDVTDKTAIEAAVAQAHERFGRLDVVVNNAGYGHFGTVEEVTEDEARRQIETNLFGPLWVSQAVLPILREQGGGHVLQVSSIGGLTAFVTVGLYHASKWALEGFSQAMAREVEDFGIKVTIIEPAGFDTDWSGPSASTSEPLEAYDGVREKRRQMVAARTAGPGDPEATGPVVLELVDMDDPPLRLLLGVQARDIVMADYEARIAEWERYDALSRRAHGST